MIFEHKIFDCNGVERMVAATDFEKSKVWDLMLEKQFGEVEGWKRQKRVKRILMIPSLED